MAGKNLPFSGEEYRDRLEKVRREMGRQGLDLLWVSDPSNMSWLTGYDGWSFYVHQGVLVGHEGDPVWWGREMDANGARLTVHMGDGDIVGYPDNLVQSPGRHPMGHLAALVRERAPGARRLGVEMDNYYYSAAAHAELGKGLPGVELADATSLVNWRRLAKSPAEIGLMRQAARIVERMHETIRANVRPGVRKNELVGEILKAGALGADGTGGDYPAIVPLLPTGADASAPHLAWDDRPMREGAGTFFEIAGCVRRYHCPLCRTVHLGGVPDRMRRAEAALIEGLEAGLEAARPGNRAREVARALRRALEKAGIDRGGRCGYSIGLSYPPDWGERTVSFREEDETELAPGMAFHFMPGLWMDDWGIEITESILVREQGPAECLANVGREIFVP